MGGEVRGGGVHGGAGVRAGKYFGGGAHPPLLRRIYRSIDSGSVEIPLS